MLFILMLFTGMNADMRAEVVSASEGSPTPLALVALLACVSPDVVHERAGVREASSADVALVRFLSCRVGIVSSY